MAGKQGYIGVFSPGGKLVAYTDDRAVVREIIRQVEATLPKRAPDKPSGILIEARRAALKALLGDSDE